MAKKAKITLDDLAIAKATLNQAQIPPRKARYIIDMIRGESVDIALQLLRNTPRKGARVVEKLLRSALANAVQHSGVDIDRLSVIGARVNMGRTQKRIFHRARGMANTIKRKRSRITLLLGERV